MKSHFDCGRLKACHDLIFLASKLKTKPNVGCIKWSHKLCEVEMAHRRVTQDNFYLKSSRRWNMGNFEAKSIGGRLKVSQIEPDFAADTSDACCQFVN